MSGEEGGRRAIPVGPVGQQVRENLVRLRQVRRLTTRGLAEICERLGRPIPATGITRIEKGERRVDVDDLAVLARALEVTCQQLMGQPSACAACHGTPPVGFVCKECGAGA